MKRRRFLTRGAAAGTAALSATTPVRAEMSGRSPGGDRRRVLFLAIDGMDAALVSRYLDHLPNMRRMMAEGYSGRILPYVSCWGNIDFMSMMTGASPGTQYRPKRPDGGLPHHQNCVSETIWQVLSGEGRRSLLFDFPGSHPDENTAVVTGSTLERGAVYQTPDVELTGLHHEKMETTGWPPGGGPKPGRRPTVVDAPAPARGWSSLPPSVRPPLEIRLGSRPALVLAAESNYDTLVVFERGNGPELGRTTLGEWSDWFAVTVKGRAGRVRYQLLEASPDGRTLQVLRSAVCAVDGFAEPPKLALELAEKVGPIWSSSAIPPTPHDPYWKAGEAEALEGLGTVADAALAALGSWDWDFFLHKVRLVDDALHQCLTMADPFFHGYDPALGARADMVLRQSYTDLDTVVGRLLEALEKRGDTVLVVASDHGGGVNNVVCDVNQRLRDVGLLAGTDRAVDWAGTRAYTKRSRQGTEIFVNLKGREPDGIVEPGEYERTQEAVIDTLLDWRGPVDNQRVATYALKLRDAALIGYWGDDAGDVQFCYNPGFVWGVNPDGTAIAVSTSPVSNHGPQVVTGETGYSSMMGQLLAWGPGVARGVKRDEPAAGPIPIASVAPTLARLLGCSTPADSQLRPIGEMLG